MGFATVRQLIFDAAFRNRTLFLRRNDEHHFDPDSLTILQGESELPLLQRGEDELRAREGLRENDAEVLKAAGLIDNATDHHQGSAWQQEGRCRLGQRGSWRGPGRARPVQSTPGTR